MKKLLLLGLLSVVTLGVATSQTQAFQLFPRLCCWRCNKYSTTICVRPYNAFSPVAYGNIVADGCMPLNIGPGYFPPSPMMPSCFGGNPYMAGGMPPYASAGMMPGHFAHEPMITYPQATPVPSAPAAQPFTAPFPTPVPNGANYGPYHNGLVRAAYQPAYYPVPQPMYNPYGYAGYQPGYYPAMPMANYAVPGYWYGQR